GNAFVQQVLAAVDDASVDGDDSAIGGGVGPSGDRFARDARLHDVEMGAAELALGDQGPAVRKVQQALYDLGYQPVSVTGTYDALTVERVQDLQHNVGLTRHDGVVDRDTFLWIEKGFKGESGLRRYARAAQREAPGLKNTPKRQDADHPQTA